MAESKTTLLLKHTAEQLADLEKTLDALSFRQRILGLIELQNSFRRLGKAIVAETGYSSGGARDRIRKYFVENQGQIVDGDEIAVISGISEYARRIRELREEDMEIITGPGLEPETGVRLKPNQYLYSGKKK